MSNPKRISLRNFVGKSIKEIKIAGAYVNIIFVDNTAIHTRLENIFDTNGNWFKELVEE